MNFWSAFKSTHPYIHIYNMPTFVYSIVSGLLVKFMRSKLEHTCPSGNRELSGFTKSSRLKQVAVQEYRRKASWLRPLTETIKPPRKQTTTWDVRFVRTWTWPERRRRARARREHAQEINCYWIMSRVQEARCFCVCLCVWILMDSLHNQRHLYKQQVQRHCLIDPGGIFFLVFVCLMHF